MSRVLPILRKRRDLYGHLNIEGYQYHGPFPHPLAPQFIVMEDRADGTDYVLTHTGTAGSLAVSLSATIPTSLDKTLYGPYDGPCTDEFRLYISGGVLAAEAAPGITSQLVLTRRNREVEHIHITAPLGVLTYEEISY